MDETGSSIPGLTENELTIAIDGKEQPISSLTSAFEGGVYLSVALLFDRSGSMKDAIDESKKAGLAFLKGMSGEDRIAVISFDHEVEVNSIFKKDREMSAQAIENISLGGDTALYDAIQKAFVLLDKETTPRQACVILSDGKDTKSRLQRDELLEELKNKNVPIFAINLDTEGDENNLKDLAQKTGGNYFEAATPNELLFLYKVIADQLNFCYDASLPYTIGLSSLITGEPPPEDCRGCLPQGDEELVQWLGQQGQRFSGPPAVTRLGEGTSRSREPWPLLYRRHKTAPDGQTSGKHAF